MITAQRVSYPSAQLQPPPAFTFTNPDGWETTEIPHGWCAVHPTAQPSPDFWTHCAISSSRVHPSTTLSQASLAHVMKLQRSHPDAAVGTRHAGRFGDRATCISGIDFTDRTGLELSQVVALFFAPIHCDRDVADLFSIVGTAPRSHLGEFGPTFIEIIASFDFPS